ncbi:MAG: DUF6754 domain-containing protein [Bellilinea sp.]
MISFVEVAGLVLILAAAGIMIWYRIMINKKGNPEFRQMAAFDRLKKAVGLAVEDGSRIHVTLGKSSLTQASNPSALAALATLDRIGSYASMSDRPPIATSGDGGLALLSQDTLKAVYRGANAPEMYDPNRVYMSGITPLSYIAGTLPIVTDEDVSAHVMIGNFGPEIGLLTEAATAEGAFTLAASDSLPAQAVIYASAEEPLIGEELFAAPAYLKPSAAHSASIKTQDFLRWGVIGVLIAGSILKLVGAI